MNQGKFNDPGAARRLTADLRLALVFLTRLPVRAPAGATRPLADVVYMFPLVGVIVGLLGGLAYGIADWIGLPAILAAVIAVAVLVLATGGLHEDALADVADGFGAGGGRDRILAIMRDSRLGTYGALALILATVARIAALAALGHPTPALAALVGAGAAGRTAAAGLMLWLPPARSDGLGAGAGRPTPEGIYVGITIAALIVWLMLGFRVLVIGAVLGGGLALLTGGLARRKIGGQTGDVLGAAVMACEIGVLLAAVIVHA